MCITNKFPSDTDAAGLGIKQQETLTRGHGLPLLCSMQIAKLQLCTSCTKALVTPLRPCLALLQGKEENY